MSVLFAVKSCQRDKDAGFHQTIRETWGKGIGDICFAPPIAYLPPKENEELYLRHAELRFFFGIGSGVLNDEILVLARDGYADLPYKVREITRYFLKTEHDYVFLCDTDTFVVPIKLLNCGYDNYDLTGIFIKGLQPGQKFVAVHGSLKGKGNYAPPSGGFGYFLSRKAAEIIANTEPDPNVTEDDIYVGEALGPHFASGELIGRQPPDYHDYAFHFPKYRQEALPENVIRWMRRMYAQHIGVVR